MAAVPHLSVSVNVSLGGQARAVQVIYYIDYV